jgi:hypothetical protein
VVEESNFKIKTAVVTKSAGEIKETLPKKNDPPA